MSARILWADDEIDLLKPHILFLESKGYRLDTVTSGDEAIEKVEENNFDIIFLDENMPGISGLETLNRIKLIKPDVPVVMITKSEEESIMEDAIGGKIADYLIKPVNPNQILLSLKKNLENRRIVSEKVNTAYQQEFRQIAMQLSSRMNVEEWYDLYRKLINWELRLDASSDKSMHEILTMQKKEANQLFSRFVSDNYTDWLAGGIDAPAMSHTLLKKNLFSKLNDDCTFLVVIDNLRYDQWCVLRPRLSSLFNVVEEDLFLSILPTATQYARNALFAGLMPSEIQKKFPAMWINEDEEGSKNQYEKEFLEENLKRNGKQVKMSYNKITNLNAGRKLVENFNNLLGNQLNVLVYNFVDMLSHARTDMEVIRELADDESAYRSLTQSWFEHSPLLDFFKKIAAAGKKVHITTDHGTIRVKTPAKVVGDRNTNTNLRYKQGKNLNYDKSDVLEFRNPGDVYLPKQNMTTSYIFAQEDKYFVYPNNYNQFVNFYNNTFQHGGISLEEMIIPFVELRPK
ncbi:MAG: PglZ domain-containing protein [Flavobacteriales bacterium]